MAPGLGLGLGLAAGCGRGVPTGLGGRLGFGWVVGVGFVGAWALAAAGLLAVGAGLEARLGGVPRGLGGGVLDEDVVVVVVKVLPWVVVGAGGLGAGKTSGAGTRGVSLDVVIGGRTGHSDTNGGESSDNRSKIHADCGPAENPSL